MANRDEEYLVCRGWLRDVRFADVHGVPSPAKEGLSGLSDAAQNSFAVRFHRLCQNGRLPNPEQIRQLDHEIWEFRIRSGWRITAFQIGRVWFLANVFPKPGKRRLKQEIQRAWQIRAAHLGNSK